MYLYQMRRALSRCNPRKALDFLSLRRKSIAMFGISLTIIFWYSAHNALVSRHLWFWWDELTILESQEAGLAGIFHGHFGNFFPLFRLLFIGEVELFKNSYWLYILVNSFLVLLLAIALGFLSFRLGSRSISISNQFLIATLVSVLFLFSEGTLYTVQWAMMQKWHIAVLLVVGGAFLGGRSTRPFAVLMTSIVFSSLFMSSAALSLSLVGLSVLTIVTSGIIWSKNSFLKAFSLVVGSGGLSLSGYLIANQNLPADLSVILPQRPKVSIQLLINGIAEVSLGTLLWIYKPFISFTSSLEESKWLLLGVIKSRSFDLWLPIVLLLLPALLLILVLRKSPVHGISALLSGSAVLLIQLQIVGRGQGTWLQTNLESRYDPLLLFAVITFWMALFLGLVSILKTNRSHWKHLHFFFGGVLSVMVSSVLLIGVMRVDNASDEARRNEQSLIIQKLRDCPATFDFSKFYSVQERYQDKLCQIWMRISGG